MTLIMTSAAPSTSINANRYKGFAHWFIFVCTAMRRRRASALVSYSIRLYVTSAMA
jgi:hypothetical protein